MSAKDKEPSSKSGGFLGSLRSEFDNSDSGLHRDFETLAGLSVALRSAYLGHRIKPESAAELFQQLRLRGNDGREWTIGASTGGWYSRVPGAGQWQSAASPVGIEPVGAERPDWLDEGIARHLSEVDSSVIRSGPTVVVNPFQPKSPDSVQPGGVIGGPRAGGGAGGDDVDWILEEWSDFDSQVEELRGLRARVEPEREPVPAKLPKGLKADKRLNESLTGGQAPAQRAEEAAGGLNDRQVNPEDFFFRPDE